MTGLKRNALFGILPVLIGVLLLGSCTPESVDVTDEIREANKVFLETISAEDAKAVSMLYTEDAVMYPPNFSIITGRNALERGWKGDFELGFPTLEIETVSAEATGNTAVEDGRYRMSVDGNVVGEGKYISIWKKVNGQWLIDKDIWNSSN